MRVILLACLASLACMAGQVTVLIPTGSGTYHLFVDGQGVRTMKGGSKVTLEIPNGKHFFRIDEPHQACALEVTGAHVLRLSPYHPSSLVEVSPADRDVQRELAQAKDTDK